MAEAAAVRGVGVEPLRKVFRETASRPTQLGQALSRLCEKPFDAATRTAFGEELGRNQFSTPTRLTTAAELLNRRVAHSGPPPEVTTNLATGQTHLHWGRSGAPRDPGAGDLRPPGGRVVVLQSDGAQIGDRNHQVNVFEHEVVDPEIDIGELVKRPEVSAALENAARNPGDPEARQQLYQALSTAPPREGADWTASFAAPGSAETRSSSARFDGTVIVTESRGVQIGDRNHQENRIVHAVSPRIDAARLLAGNSQIVDSLVQLAHSGGRGKAVRGFTGAVERAITAEMSVARATTSGHGAVHRPPAPGRTLRITQMAGVSVGHRASQKNHHVQRARVGNSVGRTARKSVIAARRGAK